MNTKGGSTKFRFGGGNAREVGGAKGGRVLVLDELDDALTKTEGVIKDIFKDISKEYVKKNIKLDDKYDAKQATKEDDVKQDVVEAEVSLKLDDLFDNGSNYFDGEAIEKFVEEN